MREFVHTWPPEPFKGPVMAYSEVIQDSDDDGGASAVNSPLLAPIGASIQDGTTLTMPHSLQNGTGSTDSVLFQQIYDEQLTAGEDLPGRCPEAGRTSVDESVSSPLTGRKKLKRSKTINTLSSALVSEQTTSVRKPKRSKSVRDVEILSPDTTPMSRDSKEKDLWEFPGSSSSDYLPSTSAAMKDRQAGSGDGLKAYGRSIQKSHDIAGVHSSTQEDRMLVPEVGEAILQERVLKRSTRSGGDDDLFPMLPKPKRPRRSKSTHGDMPVEMQMDLTDNHQLQDVHLEPFPNTVSKSSIPSDREEPLHSHHNFGTAIDNSAGLVAGINDNDAIAIVEPSTISLAAENFETTDNSIETTVDTLTDSREKQHSAVSAASTVQSHRTSLPHMMDPVDLNLKYTGDSSTIPNETQPPDRSPATIQPILLSSSPPLSVDDRTKVRGLETVPEAPASLSTSNSKCIRGSIALGSGNVNPHRESSIDELSLVSLETPQTPLIGRRKGKEKEQIGEDEFFDFEDIGLPKELYRPRPSLRRSKSTSAQIVNSNIELGVVKRKAKRMKSANAGRPTGTPSRNVAVLESNETMALEKPGTYRSSSAQKSSTEDDTGFGKVEKPENDIGTLETAAESERVPITPTIAQPRRRGRPRKSETNMQGFTEAPAKQQSNLVATANEILATDSATTHGADRKAPDLSESGRAAETSPARTPTKAVEEGSAKAGPTQHSPLQNGKVAYRVGLSKKTRIAPLLRMIKK